MSGKVQLAPDFVREGRLESLAWPHGTKAPTSVDSHTYKTRVPLGYKFFRVHLTCVSLPALLPLSLHLSMPLHLKDRFVNYLDPIFFLWLSLQGLLLTRFDQFPLNPSRSSSCHPQQALSIQS